MSMLSYLCTLFSFHLNFLLIAYHVAALKYDMYNSFLSSYYLNFPSTLYKLA